MISYKIILPLVKLPTPTKSAKKRPVLLVASIYNLFFGCWCAGLQLFIYHPRVFIFEFSITLPPHPALSGP